MAKQNFDFLDGLSENKTRVVKLDSMFDKIKHLADNFKLMIVNELDKAGSYSSGTLHKSIVVNKVEKKGNDFEVTISMAGYADFINEGVDGWGGPSKGGKYKFKTKGVPDAMVKSVSEWIKQSKKVNVSVAVSKIEKKGQSLADKKITQAKSIAFMIKRQGIEGTHFFNKAKKEFETLLSTELGVAVRVLIKDNLI